MTHYDQLKKVLNEIFELDKADLDFGIYRIMNQKRKQVNEFIDKQLPADISKALSETQTADKAELEGELKTLKKNLEDAGVVAEEVPKYKQLKVKLAQLDNSDVLEQEVFSHLANFFRRYYKDGDFISMRRYKKDVYAIPYEGEEVKLHWANADQYYIKSSENFKNYSFLLGDNSKVTFQLKEVSTEQNNNKTQGDAERRFAIFEEMPVEVINGELLINFIYEPFPKAITQDSLKLEAYKTILEKIPDEFSGLKLIYRNREGKDKTRKEKVNGKDVEFKVDILFNHLDSYISKNSFDYFIHKDLGGFLSRELDFYIKNEVLYIDDINARQTDFFVAQLSKVKAIKTVATKVIDFLAQIENFQKKLWLKKKFVLRTDYCITLDRIPADYYPEIFANKAQLAEWKTLFDVELQNESQLAFEQFLVLDTKFFDEAFKDRLLAEFDDLDEQTNGVLINSENFQALGLMQEKYQESVTSVYIDPPYNTEGDGFIYKDSFKHSSWLSLMYDRLYLSKSMLYENANLFTSIDNREQENLKLLLCNVFGSENFVESFLWTKTSTPPALSNKSRKTVEYIHCFEKNVCNLEYCGELLDNGDAPLLNSGNPIKELVFPPQSIRFKIPDGLISPSIPDKVEIINSFNIKNGFNVEEVTLKGQFKWKQETLIEEIQKGTYFVVKSEKFSIRFQREDVGGYKAPNNKLSTELDKNENVDTNEGALKEINNLGVFDFSFPKPSSLIGKLLNFNQLLKNNKLFLDYFAGSGTTGHATIKLNREDNGNRKYILVEMGTYFNTVTKPRIQKVIYSDNWKNGKPQDKVGISQMFKYQVLESYEDTLNNLMLSDVGNQAQLDFSERAQEEYLLHYMLEMESREHLFNLEMFRKPFSYQLKVTENNELKPTNVDLVETFNYLIGLYVSKVQRVKDIKVVEGVTRTGIKTLVIWRDMETTTHDDVVKLVRRFYDSARTREFQQIYINGDHHLENLTQSSAKIN